MTIEINLDTMDDEAVIAIKDIIRDQFIFRQKLIEEMGVPVDKVNEKALGDIENYIDEHLV